MRAAIGLPTVESPRIAECLEQLIARKESTRPGSTYRLQFNANFRFEDARALLPYLQALGITHCYASPILRARAGSQHGYDITDHNMINPEIGTPEEFEALARDMKALGMGLILDIVPNHMGVGHGTNPWWQDVLENGQASAYADYFDIDWRPLKDELEGKVLLPVLGAAYGDELEKGLLKINFESGAFFVSYYDKRFPLDPQTYPIIFEQLGSLGELYPEDQAWRDSDAVQLHSLIRNFRELPPNAATDPDAKARRQRTVGVLKQQLGELAENSPKVKAAIDEAVRRANGDPQNAHSFDVLHRILEAQAYRVAHWRVSAEEINYRRFFDVNDLVGLRMENPPVFAATHKLIRRLLADEYISGIRLDHPDGLLNPVQYFSRMQMLYAASHCCGKDPSGPLADNGIEHEVVSCCSSEEITHDAPLFLLVEKILEAGEHLPKDWPVDGTVGYEFGNLLNNVFINSRARRFFTTLYHRFIGGPIEVSTLIYESKKKIMLSSLSSEVAVLTHILEEISGSDRRARDFTRSLLRNSIRETIACFPVYRTYIDARGTVSENDRGYIQEAIARAKRRNQNANHAVYDFLRSVLLLEGTHNNGTSEDYRKRLLFALKFQQLSGPVMAKGLEDTACYVYNRLVSVNEVGGSPQEFGIGLEEFHHGNLERAQDWPYSMLTTSTHDSKRSEDVRARINVLSEMQRPWSDQVTRWRRANRSKKRAISDGRVVPDHNEEYLLYQTLVGTWPFRMNGENREEYVRRMQDYMIKAVHEAKVNLSWLSQNQEYSDHLTQFVERILQLGTEKRPNTFLEQFEDFHQPVAFFGAINALAQVLIKATAPGVPDFYRGCELWDFSVVDPDNRRPVDYALRQRLLADLLKRGHEDAHALCEDMMRDISDGRAKLWTTMRVLRFRREHPELFKAGSEYIPLFVDGAVREHVIAFARQREGQWAIALAPRFAYTLMKGELQAPVGTVAWGDAAILLPANAPAEFTNYLNGGAVRAQDARLLCREVFGCFPVTLLSNV